MVKVIYKFTREIAILATGVVIISLLAQNEYIRAVTSLFSFILFYIVSKEYEKKYRAISVTYAFIFIIVYFEFSVIAAFCNRYAIDKLNIGKKYGYWSGDYYPVYFMVTTMVYIFIWFYLKLSKNNISENICGFKIKAEESRNLTYGCLLIIGVYILAGVTDDFMFPVIVCSVGKVLYDKRSRFINIAFVILVLFLSKSIILTRYKFIQCMLPIIFMVFTFTFAKKKKASIIKINILFIAGIFAAGLYGTVSEIYKLNTHWNGNYDLKAVLLSVEETKDFFMKQFYRIFAIWIKLGGYIIGHADINGYYYGLTYIKSLSGIFEFDYISLPLITAVYDKAHYAQPGLLAEGYANFGIIGAVLNICIVFILMDFFQRKFCKNPDFANFLYATVPFTKIILDGGTLNSAIYILAICVVVNIFNIIQKLKWNGWKIWITV